VQPRVFDERFPRLVLYINDVSASGTQWHGVFLAEAGGENGSRVTLAENAIVIAEPKQGKLELHLQGGSTHEFGRTDPDHYSVTAFGQSDIPIEVTGVLPTQPRQLSNPERPLRQLATDNTAAWREARVEMHRRFAFPVACLAFALIAVPLGAQPRRGGRAAGSLIAVILIASYYLLLIMGAGMAHQGTVPPAIGMWIADTVLVLAGLALLPRMEQFRGESRWLKSFGRVKTWIRLIRVRTVRVRTAAGRMTNGSRAHKHRVASSSGSLPLLMDLYLLRKFFSYFAMLMLVFVFLFEAFTFFELLDDIARHRIAFIVVVEYFWFLTPYLIYQLAPLAALVSILATLGIMSKNNEIVACKASGISLYRLAIPTLFAGLALAGSMIVLDDTFLPYANQRQDALRNQIKGRPAQTYKQPERWIFGQNSKIYNYDLFDPAQNLFGGLTVLEVDPVTFEIRRRIFAARAQWSQPQKLWLLESGWVREFDAGKIVRYERFNVKDLPELTEPPSYFNREVLPAIQMSWPQLRRYIDDLHRAGFDVSALTVQWHRKLAFPLIAPVSMLLAFPFAFLVGTRGAIGGVTIGIAIGIIYWLGAELLAAMGGIGQLPPLLAGWSPDIIFFFLGLYFFFKMPT
jgi:LPS export ABC transporter permease LptG